MKAWQVEDKYCYEGHCELVFAETRGKAILKSEAYGMSGEYIDMRAIRLDFLDDKEDMPEREKQILLIRNGWWFEIRGGRIDEDNLDLAIEMGWI